MGVPLKFALCIHDHQPVGNFGFVLESAFSNCYLPMIEELERHPGIRIGLHISGPLLEWMEAEKREFICRIADLCAAGRMELLTSGRYESILPVLPAHDIIAQVREFSEHIQQISGTSPKGLWLTERVWEPQLASTLSLAGVDYVVVDDVHLLRAGVPCSELNMPWTTGDSGKTIKLLASSRRLRYMIPFSPVQDVMDSLMQMHQGAGGMVFYGDDGEKFGVWPGTADLCYRDGWLSQFFSALESADWIETVLPSEAAAIPSGGGVYVPAASYAEMGEWTLKADAALEYRRARELLSEQLPGEIVDVLVPGGFWRNFQSIYPESAELLGRMISAMDPIRRADLPEALQHLWRSQCNCAYWHGVFGGIYLPHLREALWKELSMAERLSLQFLDEYPRICREDIDSDGCGELLVVTPSMSVLAHPERGLTVTELTLVPGQDDPIPVGHVLSRIPESYHAEIEDTSTECAPGNIHGALPAKEEGLAQKLIADRWRRCIFTDLHMPLSFGLREWVLSADGIEHSQTPVWKDVSVTGRSGAMIIEGSFGIGDGSLSKRLEIGLAGAKLKASSNYVIQGVRFGMEICVNMMTGASPDRYLRIGGSEDIHKLGDSGEAVCSSLEVTDLYRGVRVLIKADQEVDLWFAPIESVNRSESGFERVHQGIALYLSREAVGSMNSLELELTIGGLDDG